MTPSKNQLEDEGFSEQELSLISRISPKQSPKSSMALEHEISSLVAQKKTLKYNLPMAYAAGGTIEENRQKFRKLLDIFGVEIILNMEVSTSS